MLLTFIYWLYVITLENDYVTQDRNWNQGGGGSVQRFLVLSVQAHRKYLYFFFIQKKK